MNTSMVSTGSNIPIGFRSFAEEALDKSAAQEGPAEVSFAEPDLLNEIQNRVSFGVDEDD